MMMYAELHLRRRDHLISDEVFALSVLTSPDLADPSTFVSALSLRPKLIDCDPERVHVVWSMSKDLGFSGIRLVILYLA